MTTVKRITDLSDYTTVLPYASELFGVYQPLLGWKSKRIAARIADGYRHDKRAIVDTLVRSYAPLIDVQYGANQQVTVTLKPGVLSGSKLRAFDTVIQSMLADLLPPVPPADPSAWLAVISRDRVEALLSKDVVASYVEAYGGIRNADAAGAREAMRARMIDSSPLLARRNAQTAAFEHQLARESSISGLLLQLAAEKRWRQLAELFYVQRDEVELAQELMRRLEAPDGVGALVSIDTLDPTDREQLAAVVLSPISVVHLFRQYFFELDTFLGTPVSHVWLSPGSSVELVEVQTRRTTTEKTLQTTLETTLTSETTSTTRDELSDAVKEENNQDIKFGASVKVSYSSVEATTSFDYAKSQKQARETTHKQMREQTDKLSSQIRKNFTSTFKQVTEFTDVSSVKHLMANTTKHLINYELRRKMRQVGVQVQDIGTYLCWQTYVDDPGRSLGVAELVHIAKPADLDGIPHPEEIPLMQPFQETKMAAIPFISVDNTSADNEGGVYVDGVEADNSEWLGLTGVEKIQADFAQEFVAPKANYELTNVEFDPQGKPATLSRRGAIENAGGTARFTLHLDSVNFQGENSLQVGLTLHWSPASGANDEIKAKNQANLAAFKESERAAYVKAHIETIKERVTLASQITKRNSDELREEERVVVYRKLIQDMLLHGIEFPDDRTRHATAELLSSIFDVDKMLYFVSPEWWRPRLHRGRQQLQPSSPATRDIASTNETRVGAALRRGLANRVSAGEQRAQPSPLAGSTAGWGGVGDPLRDNYLITESSEPARLGSSLGWLLQLDGDNMRNAFLNAPWVKAVMPIRPGKEAAAINWLKAVEGMNGITDDVLYHANNAELDVHGNPLDGQKLVDVLKDLAEKIRRKYEEGILTAKYPKPSDVSDPQLVDAENEVTATPIDRVYEHGFFPLEGSFRANVGANYEIFDQWIEILPTDQIVPVEVQYDPRTGRMLPP